MHGIFIFCIVYFCIFYVFVWHVPHPLVTLIKFGTLECILYVYVYTFQASDDHIQQFSRLLQLSVEDYMNETKSALSTHGGSTDYTYLVKDGQFVWKKLDQCSRVRMKYGYIQLEEVRCNVCLMAVDVCWDGRAFDLKFFRNLCIDTILGDTWTHG